MSKKFKNFCLYAFYAVVILAALFSLFAPTIEGFPSIKAQWADPKFETVDLGRPVAETEIAESPSLLDSIAAYIADAFAYIMKFFANIFSSGSEKVAAEEVLAL